MNMQDLEKVLENVCLDIKTKDAIRQAMIATFELEEGFYYSKWCGITEVRSPFVSENGKLITCKVWSISSCPNMSRPEWIKKFMKKIDIKKLDKCPLCNGKGDVNMVENFKSWGGSDYSYDLVERECIFCKTFEKIKNGEYE